MSNSFFLILFTCLLYAIIRYFSYITKDRESHENGGRLNNLFVGRLIFWLGGIILTFFIYDIFRIQLSVDRFFLIKGLAFIILTILLLIFGEVLVKKLHKKRKK